MRYFIYFLFESKGHVHDYVPHFLNAVRPHYDVIHVVSNGVIQPDHKAKLTMADTVQERPNDEFDVGAYKAAIFSNPDEFYANECDEVTLANFTFLGPMGSMDGYFNWVAANEDKMDFWGLSAHKSMTPNPFTGTGVLPYHIQSHWISFGKKTLQSGAFIDYWRNMPPIKSYMDSVLIHESQCTSHFEGLGYGYKLYFDDAPFDSAYPAFNDVDETVAAGLPILKRRLFYHTPTLYFDQYDVNVRRALDDIRDRDLFDLEMVWQTSKGTDPGVFYQTTDNLRVVPDGRFSDGDVTEASPAVILLTRRPTPEDVAALAARIHAPLDLTLISVGEIDDETVAPLRDLPMVQSLAMSSAPSLLAAAAAVETYAIDLADDAPVLFAVLDPEEIAGFDYGMRHLAGDSTVARLARAEVAQSPHFGLGLPVSRTYGSQSEIDSLTAEAREDLRAALAPMSFKAPLKEFYLYSGAGVFWIRPKLLAALMREIPRGATEAVGLFDDLTRDTAEDDTRVVDADKFQALIEAGVPLLAVDAGFITLVLSNTRELPRNFVKAEQRLRIFAEKLTAKGPFALNHQAEYLSQFANEEERREVFGRVHSNAFSDGWAKASKAVWGNAFEAGKNAVKPGESSASAEAAFLAGKEAGLREAAERDSSMLEGEFARARFDAAYNDGWEAASRAMQHAHPGPVRTVKAWVRKVLPKR